MELRTSLQTSREDGSLVPYKDPEKKREHDRKWKAARRADPEYLERLRATARIGATRYRMRHPDRAAEWERVGKGRWVRAARSADGSVTKRVIDDLLGCPICPYCNAELTPDNLTIDHIVPISKGGTHTADNLAAICSPCNRAKHTSSLVGFLLRLAGPPDKLMSKGNSKPDIFLATAI
jgi:5-methylcytosine-specific restriction endonuclease McrA